MSLKRRTFLGAFGALTATAMTSSAFAQSVIEEILNTPRRGTWNDRFDTGAGGGEKVASNLPIFSPETVSYIEQAIGQYANIVSRGGWPIVPATRSTPTPGA